MKADDLDDSQSVETSGLLTEDTAAIDSTHRSSGFSTRLIGLLLFCAGFFVLQYLRIPSHDSSLVNRFQFKYLFPLDLFLLYVALAGLYFCLFGDLGTRWLMGRRGPLIAGGILIAAVASFLWICPLLWRCTYHLH